MAQSRRPSKPKKRALTDVEKLAKLYVQSRNILVGAGRTLHDHVGSSLSAAGVQLQLLRMDVPAAGERVGEALTALEEALDKIRDLSQELCPPAYRGGLKQTLLRLADQYSSAACDIRVEYSATAVIPAEIAAGLYETSCAAVEVATQQGATCVNITVRGNGGLVVRIGDDGRKTGRARSLAAAQAVAAVLGLGFECTTGKGTIVSIRYAIRRPTRG